MRRNCLQKQGVFKYQKISFYARIAEERKKINKRGTEDGTGGKEKAKRILDC